MNLMMTLLLSKLSILYNMGSIRLIHFIHFCSFQRYLPNINSSSHQHFGSVHFIGICKSPEEISIDQSKYFINCLLPALSNTPFSYLHPTSYHEIKHYMGQRRLYLVPRYFGVPLHLLTASYFCSAKTSHRNYFAYENIFVLKHSQTIVPEVQGF